MEVDDLLPLSGLQHLVFCERQFALIHVEGLWAENTLTISGRQLHERADLPGQSLGAAVRVARALPLRSDRLGLAGKADVVEFHREADVDAGILWRPFPVEYKRGRPKPGGADEVQLCAQAICLEEMLGLEVPRGALFYGSTRRRKAVAFTLALRVAPLGTPPGISQYFVLGRCPAGFPIACTIRTSRPPVGSPAPAGPELFVRSGSTERRPPLPCFAERSTALDGRESRLNAARSR